MMRGNDCRYIEAITHFIFLLLNAVWSSLLGIGHLGLALIDGTPGEFRFSGLSADGLYLAIACVY
jgi:hypothetical protein